MTKAELRGVVQHDIGIVGPCEVVVCFFLFLFFGGGMTQDL